MSFSSSRPYGRPSYDSTSSHRMDRGRDHPLYRQGSNMSSVSYMSEVEMAQDEVFSGPVPEGLASSVTGFSHRRERANSTASFIYYSEGEDSDESSSEWPEIDEHALGSDEEMEFQVDSLDTNGNGDLSPTRRKSSVISRSSAEHPLLRRLDSMKTEGTGAHHDPRVVQKLYLAAEDLTIVLAGFSTSRSRYVLYIALCIATFGSAFLLLRWVPSWRVALIGVPTPLESCEWVVIENQWGEFSIQRIKKQPYQHAYSTVFGATVERDGNPHLEEDDPPLESLRSLHYRYMQFLFNPRKDKFQLDSAVYDPIWKRRDSLSHGLEEDEKERLQLVFGPNVIDIEQKPISALLMDEVLHPFYVFQIASLVLWSLDEYYYYATCIFLISLISITTTLLDTRATMSRLREISRHECDTRVLRDGFWREVSSQDLVPGDVYELSDPSLTQFPCDSLLITGDCIVNESMLTGESVPVSKTPADEEAFRALDVSATTVHAGVAKHFLFAGTKIIRVRRPQGTAEDEAVALGLVLRTGFDTTKGSLVRSMLFPKPTGFKFHRDSFRYISVMAMVAAIGFTASLVNFIRLNMAWHFILVRALDLITIVVPPALPATLTIGINFALSRLKARQIFCISPQRINVGGKLDIMCFDKTGTLTEEGLDVLGLRVVNRARSSFSDLLVDASSLMPGATYERDPTLDYTINRAALFTMATCHSLRLVDDELVGDPLDVKMFEFTGWSFEEGRDISDDPNVEPNTLAPSVARPPPGVHFDVGTPSDAEALPVELGVLKSFEFVSQLRRASVIVRRFGDQGGEIYVKGAPECMRDICVRDSFPEDYDELLSYYTHRGFRVIACATKRIPKISWLKVQKMQRHEAESELDFLGFIIFENKLKDATVVVIDELNDANIRNVMCTGDNILTAISVARECHMLDRSAHCFVPYFEKGDGNDSGSRLKWQSIDNTSFELDAASLLPLPPPNGADASLPFEVASLGKFSIAMTGEVFRWLVEYGSQDLLHKSLVGAKVFARMSPDEKHELVEKLQSIDYCCGFCGDGANDCGALKAADVGISLSEAEASVAAPFTSRVFDISCVPEVIREGRAALVTSFSCFKYMSLYSAIQFTTVSFLYASASNLGDFQFLFIDLFLILPIAIFMGWTGPYPSLSQKRPTASLVSRKVLTPLLGQIVFSVAAQAIVFELVQQQSWYIPPTLDRERPNIMNSQNTALFLVSCFQYILSSVILSRGPPFRQTMAQNLPFVITIITALFISLYLLFDPADAVAAFMQLTMLSNPFHLLILIIALAWFLVAYFAEKVLLIELARGLGLLHDRMWPQRKKRRKQYKVIAEEMRV